MNLHQTILRCISSAASLFLLTLVLTVTMQAQSSSVDLSFNATPSRESGSVGNFVFQPDGKIFVLNGIFIINGVAKNQITRLNSDGSSDLHLIAPPVVISISEARLCNRTGK